VFVLHLTGAGLARESGHYRIGFAVNADHLLAVVLPAIADHYANAQYVTKDVIYATGNYCL
jgi:hypothetical protein